MTATATPVARRRPAAAAPLLVALFLVGLNLRAAMASVPPLLGEIERDLGLNGFAAGMLTSLPVLCMGLFAPLGHRVAARLGRETAVTVALGLLTGGLALRLGGSLPPLYAGTLLAGIGIAVVGTVLPGVVKEHFPSRAGAVTGVYTSAMSLGAALAAGLAVPFRVATGAWQSSLALWALPVAAALAVWVAVAARGGALSRDVGAPAPGRRGGLPWRSRTAWLVSAYLALGSTLFYSSLAWIAPSYVARGWPAEAAGTLLAAFMAAQIVATLVAPPAADRFRDRRPLFAAAAGLQAAGLLALVLAPGLAPYLIVTFIGLGQGAAFALGLVLLVDYAPDPHDSGRLAAMAFLLSYSVAALGPAVAGALRDLSGGFTVPFLLLLAVNAAQLAGALLLSPTRRL